MGKRKMRKMRKIICLLLGGLMLLEACGRTKTGNEGRELSGNVPPMPEPVPTEASAGEISPISAPLPEIPVDEAHFPDAAFRKYLYLYADEIASLQGIEYFPNLYEIQLKGVALSEEAGKLCIRNPKLEILDLLYAPGELREIHLDCPKLRYCSIVCSGNRYTLTNDLEGKSEEEVAKVFLDETKELQVFYLHNACVGSWEGLGLCTGLKEIHLTECFLTDGEAAYLGQLGELRQLSLYAGNKTVLEELDLSGCRKLENAAFLGFALKKLVLLKEGVSCYFDVNAEDVEVAYTD